MRIWDPASIGAHRAEPVGRLPGVGTLAVTQGWLAVGAGDGVRLWDPVSGAERAVLTGHGQGVLALAAPANGSWLASAGGDATIRVWDPAEGQGLTVSAVCPFAAMRCHRWERVSSPLGGTYAPVGVLSAPSGRVGGVQSVGRRSVGQRQQAGEALRGSLADRGG